MTERAKRAAAVLEGRYGWTLDAQHAPSCHACGGQGQQQMRYCPMCGVKYMTSRDALREIEHAIRAANEERDATEY